jgi:hypothetical protein
MHSKSYQLPGSRIGHEKEVHLHHDGDYSGDVVISVRKEFEVVSYMPSTNGGTYELAIPFDILEKFVLDKLRGEAISAFEEADYKDLKKKLIW